MIQKVSADICQLRLDFQTFSGFATTTGGQMELPYIIIYPMSYVNPTSRPISNGGVVFWIFWKYEMN